MNEAPIDRISPIPLYFQIAESLKEAIEDGRLTPGERLDNELVLAERFGVSRPTIRQALHRLMQEGLVSRRRGLGTIVLAPRILRSVALTSLYDDLMETERYPSTVVISVAESECEEDVAEALSMSPRSTVLCLERLRLADGSPLAVMRNYLPAGLLRGWPEKELEMAGLYDVLRRQGVELNGGEQVIGARRATAREARLLETSRGATLLTMKRTAFDGAGRPVEHGSHVYLADRYSFRMTLTAPRL